MQQSPESCIAHEKIGNNCRSTMSVDILLSTYNGAAYLREQLDSLLAQTHQDWRLVVRDDGSTDDSVSIVEAYAAADPARFLLLRDGMRLGAKASFSKLMQSSDAPYMACCDQDDVWLPEKLATLLAVMRDAEAMHGADRPILVHSDLEVVSETLAVLAPTFWRHQGIDPARDALSQLIVQNVVTGCACLFNKRLRDVALPVPSAAFMHDYWLSLVASALGIIVAVPVPLVKYRQHGNNTLGAKKLPGLFSLPGKAFTRVGWALDYSDACAQARAVLAALGGDLSARQLVCLRAFADLYRQGWLMRRATLIRHGIFPARLRRQISVLLRV